MALTVRTNQLPSGDTRGRSEVKLSEIRKAGSFDVVVVGGGTGGAPAAISAGQEGLSVAVVEPQSFLGGIGTGGGIHMYYHGLQTGVQIEMDKRTDAWTNRIGGRASGFHPEAKKLALQELADEAKVRCFFRSFFVGAVVENNTMRGIVADGDDGLFWLEAKVVIDSTGDADVAAAAGAPFLFGREGDHAPQPYSLAPGHVKGPGTTEEWWGEKAKPGAKPADAVTFRNFDAGYVDPTNALDQTRAQLLGRSHLRCEKYDVTNRMIYISPILGLRESRFIDAEYVITLADQQQHRRFPDAIARAKAHYDNHALDYENESLDARMWIGGYGAWHMQMCHDVPYRSLVPKKIDNLLVACRAIGMTHDAHQLFRMQRDIQSLGEAAAVAAGIAIRSGTTVRKADVGAIQRRLVERNALPAEVLNQTGIGSVLPKDEALEKSDLPAVMKLFGDRKEAPAIQELVRRGAAIHDELRQKLKDGSDNEKLMAATVLALQKKTDGVEVLKQVFKARRPDSAHYNRNLPRYMGAFFLLDSLGLRETGSLGLAFELLNETPRTFIKLVAAIRALSRHATKEEALEPIRRAVQPGELETKLILQHSVGTEGTPITDDRQFQVDLAAAQALAKFGAVDEAIALAEKHIADERALVRNYARKVLAGLQEPAFAK